MITDTHIADSLDSQPRLLRICLLLAPSFIPALACSDDSALQPPPSQPPGYKAAVDEYPSWHPDGSSLVYRRIFWSTQGPPGIYRIRRDGSDNELILDESPIYNEGFPLLEAIRYSPDGRQLALAMNLELFILNLETSELRQLTHTNRNARSPDWSPDGKYIVYERNFRSAELDSAGTYIIEVSTGQERAFFHDGIPVYGLTPRWSPAGEPIAFTSGAHWDIYTTRSDGTDFRQLTHYGAESWGELAQWIDGGARLLYYWRLASDHTREETRVMQADGSGQTQWPLSFPFPVFLSDAISPNSREVALPHLQPGSEDSSAVLFIRELDDVAGTTMFQLTSYVPAPSPPDTSHLAHRNGLAGHDLNSQVHGRRDSCAH